MKYRIVYKKDTLEVLSVIQDESNTITSVPDSMYLYCVDDELTVVRDGLLTRGYDVTVLQDFIDNL